MPRTQVVERGVVLLDLELGGTPQVLGAYLLLDGEPALVEVGPSSCLGALEAGLAEHGLAVSDLRAVVVTHIHLDHAGAAGVLARRNPHLRVYVHPVGAPHLAHPERLVRSAHRLYGDLLEALWGEVAPVPPDRIVAVQDGERIRVGGRMLRVLNTPGHANHHHVFLDERTGLMFTGDAAGVCLPGCSVVRPPTPPPELDLEVWDRTLDRMREIAPRCLALTHFGVRDDPETVLEEMRRRLREMAEVLRPGWEAGEDVERLTERLRRYLDPEIEARCGAQTAARQETAASYRLNVLGFVRYFEKTRSASG
ncbi:MAG: MBL fold metallo-hydrolase [Armatimonadota bacterium]|nr:MBL fold metallo-hydrolase [Armatimonadota bacterium]MDR7444152.1 MBL fold metallo-hydrolase [Armatimonadota bacterium]MDR7571031.1 MBL fold metallo-hydrolase [Armatimonadota bacterium]MDR7613601.1 MBL fold metallo-hydrolase [Armatimonadota bacterium]